MRTPELIAALRTAGVETIVVGGIAMRMHGSPRSTQDLDLAIRALDVETAVGRMYQLGYVAVRDVGDEAALVIPRAKQCLMWIERTRPASVSFVERPDAVDPDDGDAREVPHDAIRVESQVDLLYDLAAPWGMMRSRSVRYVVRGIPLYVADRSDLLILKEARTDRSPADQADIAFLRSGG